MEALDIPQKKYSLFFRKFPKSWEYVHQHKKSPVYREEKEYKKSYSSIKEQGGGVLLDLSHELDYCNYLMGGDVELFGNHGRQSDITVDSEDYAESIYYPLISIVSNDSGFIMKKSESGQTILKMPATLIMPDDLGYSCYDVV